MKWLALLPQQELNIQNLLEMTKDACLFHLPLFLSSGGNVSEYVFLSCLSLCCPVKDRLTFHSVLFHPLTTKERKLSKYSDIRLIVHRFNSVSKKL